MDTIVVVADNSRCRVQGIRGDAQCLFAAVAHQMFLSCYASQLRQAYDYRSSMAQDLANLYRALAVDHIRKNLSSAFIELISHRVNEEFPELCCLDTVTKCSRFLDLLSDNGTYGGSESVLALAHVLGVNVELFRENGDTSMVSCDDCVATSTLRLVLRRPVNGRSNFDSFLRFVFGPSMPSAA